MSVKPLKMVTDKKMLGFMFALCWIAYFASYIGRLNYSSAMTEMTKSGVLSLTFAGTISMVYFFAYGSGQFINGWLGDKLPPRIMIFLGLFGAGICNLLFGLVHIPIVMAVLWGLNGFCQSMIWPPVVRIFSQMLEEHKRNRFCVNISTSIPVGTLAAYLLSACMVGAINWQAAFWSAAIVLCAIAVLWYFGFSRVERFAEKHGTALELIQTASAQKSKENDTSDTPQNKKITLWIMVSQMGLWCVLIPVMINGVLKDGMTAWVPTFIGDSFNAAAVVSILVTTVLPIVNLAGAYSAGWLNKRIPNMLKCGGVFFSFATLMLVILWLFGSYSMILSIILLALVTSSMLAVNTLLISFIPMQFGKFGKASSVSGFLNGTAYLGAAVSSFTIGMIVDGFGWSVTIFWWVVIAIIASAALFLASKVRTGEIKEPKQKKPSMS